MSNDLQKFIYIIIFVYIVFVKANDGKMTENKRNLNGGVVSVKGLFNMSFAAHFHILNFAPGSQLRPGIFCRIVFTRKQQDDIILLPKW